jgi:hypothetical protein
VRVTECDACGELLTAADQAELERRVRQHYADRHTDAAPSDAELQEMIASSYEATDS